MFPFHRKAFLLLKAEMNKVILKRAAANFGLGCSFWQVTSGEVVLDGSQWGSHFGMGVAVLRARNAVDGSTSEKEKVLLNLYVEDYIQQRLGSVTPNYNLNGWIPAGPSWNITAVNKSRRSWRKEFHTVTTTATLKKRPAMSLVWLAWCSWDLRL